MLMTFDFLADAWRDEKFMLSIKNNVQQDKDTELCTDRHRIKFNAAEKYISIYPLSQTSPFYWKIAPKRVTYSALLKMLDKDFDGLNENDIIDI